jgi:hypothetical protein
MHVHRPHFAEVVSISANSRSATARAHIVDTEASIPDYVQEDAATNAAIKNWEFSYDLGDTTLVREVQASADNGIVLRSKKRVYENSVCVNKTLVPYLLISLRSGLPYVNLGRAPGQVS